MYMLVLCLKFAHPQVEEDSMKPSTEGGGPTRKEEALEYALRRLPTPQRMEVAIEASSKLQRRRLVSLKLCPGSLSARPRDPQELSPTEDCAVPFEGFPQAAAHSRSSLQGSASSMLGSTKSPEAMGSPLARHMRTQRPLYVSL